MADGVTTETGSARIEAAFESARRDGRAALMPYLMGGFPDQGTATAVAGAYADAGADLIELGVPFWILWPTAPRSTPPTRPRWPPGRRSSRCWRLAPRSAGESPSR